MTANDVRSKLPMLSNVEINNDLDSLHLEANERVELLSKLFCCGKMKVNKLKSNC